MDEKSGAEVYYFYFFTASRQAGHRLCNHIDRSMILLKQYSQRDDDELREFCLQACEAFVLRCPDAITPHIPMVCHATCESQSIGIDI